MRILLAFVVAILLAVAPAFARATTWVSDMVRDPIAKTRVKVQQPGSYGSYIYQWPEKSDQVFWPYTDDAWLWFNPKSGYIAFGDDFEKVEQPRVEALRTWLKDNFNRKHPPKSRRELLSWAESVYSIRGMSDDFWCHFYRLMAFETRSDEAVSLTYVRKALPLLLDKANSTKEPGPTIETLYLLSEYHRRLGDTGASNRYLAQLTAFEAKDDLSGFKSYLLEIIEQQRNPPTDKRLERQDRE